MRYFEYKGKTYPFKSVYFHNEDAQFIISCEELDTTLMPNGSDYDSEEAKDIDEKVFFFVPYRILNKSDEIIEKYVNETL